MVNLFILAYLIVTIVCMVALAYVAIRQFKEVRRPRNSFTKLRWRLFLWPMVILFGLVLGLPRLLSLILPELQLPFDDTNMRVIGGIIVLISITWLTVSIYTYKGKE